MQKYVILIPCYNDWQCLNILIPKIDDVLMNIKNDINILIVNDGSSVNQNLKIKKKYIKKIEILNLKKNVKAQVAIATGLDYIKSANFDGGIIVMDADGQDDPQNLLEIIKKTNDEPNQVISINRTKRDDPVMFKLFYQAYLFICFLLTFKYMKFGVYSYIHSSKLSKILSTNDINMAYAGSLAKHFKDKNIIYAPRKKRLIDKSKNNYLSLIHYAMKIISIFRYHALICSSIYILVIIFISKDILNLTYIIFILIMQILFNFYLFLIFNKNSLIIKNRLMNVKDVENIVS